MSYLEVMRASNKCSNNRKCIYWIFHEKEHVKICNPRKFKSYTPKGCEIRGVWKKRRGRGGGKDDLWSEAAWPFSLFYTLHQSNNLQMMKSSFHFAPFDLRSETCQDCWFLTTPSMLPLWVHSCVRVSRFGVCNDGCRLSVLRMKLSETRVLFVLTRANTHVQTRVILLVYMWRHVTTNPLSLFNSRNG